MSDEKAPDLTKSTPPRAPLTDIEVVILLDRIQRDQKANRDEQRREFELIRAELATAKANDERFKVLETHFTAVKWLAGIAIAAAVVSMVNGIAGRMSVRFVDTPLPPPVSSGASTYPDRQQHRDGGP